MRFHHAEPGRRSTCAVQAIHKASRTRVNGISLIFPAHLDFRKENQAARENKAHRRTALR